MKSSDLYFEVENSGQERQFSVQVYLDYKQMPIIIDETEYTTYLVNAGAHTDCDEVAVVVTIGLN